MAAVKNTMPVLDTSLGQQVTPTMAAVKDIKPVQDTDLEQQAKKRFRDIFYDLYDVQDDDDENHYTDLSNRVIEAVDEYPVLSTVTSKYMLGWSLLQVIVEKSFSTQVHPAIKRLIQENPNALLWQWGNRDEPSSPIRSIVDNRFHLALMPWIADKFPWIFDQTTTDHEEGHMEDKKDCYSDEDLLKGLEAFEDCDDYIETPSHFTMIHRCKEMGGDHAIIRQFYEVYPEGLRQRDDMGSLPIHVYVCGWDEPLLGVAKLMADKTPESLLIAREDDGMLPLHRSCIGVLEHSTDNMAEICLYFATKCPESAKVRALRGLLPLQLLARHSNRPAVQKVMVALLRLYPEAIDDPREGIHPAPKSVPFLREVHSLVSEERTLQAEIACLAESSAAWCEAAKPSKDGLQASASGAFQMWSGLRRARLEKRLEQIPSLLADLCTKHQGDDIDYVEGGDADDDMNFMFQQEDEEVDH